VKFSIKAFGPGLIWAAAAIGVSHLVQSTRAGANYGFELVWIILLINLIKYPFFQFGPRYASASGESLMHGYQRLGSWAVWSFIVLTFLTMFGILSGVTIVTAGLFTNLIGLGFSMPQWTLIILFICGAIIYVGRFKLLDTSVKIIIVILSITTIFALLAAAGKGFNPNVDHINHFEWQLKDIAFLIALAGWMPSAIDVSVWHSFWTLAKKNKEGNIPTVKESLLDFNVGYFTTVVLALFFVGLGALIMYGSDEKLSSNGEEFSRQLINMYTSSIGSWAYYLIAIAALTTMFSTVLTVLDAYPRVMSHSYLFLTKKDHTTRDPKKERIFKLMGLLFLISGAYAVIQWYASSMQWLVDLATTLSFLTAPLLGYLNLRAMTAPHIKKEDQPGKGLIILSWIGIITMAVVGIGFLVWRYLN
jgi:Mn2+/Fe2+ NRAMP family transporter